MPVCGADNNAGRVGDGVGGAERGFSAGDRKRYAPAT